MSRTRSLMVPILLLAGCARAEPEPFDLEKAMAQWQQLCTAAGPLGSPENNTCVLQRYDTERVLAAQERANEKADRLYRLSAFGLITRGL